MAGGVAAGRSAVAQAEEPGRRQPGMAVVTTL
jgi:hypothetical protein